GQGEAAHPLPFRMLAAGKSGNAIVSTRAATLVTLPSAEKLTRIRMILHGIVWLTTPPLPSALANAGSELKSGNCFCEEENIVLTVSWNRVNQAGVMAVSSS